MHTYNNVQKYTDTYTTYKNINIATVKSTYQSYTYKSTYSKHVPVYCDLNDNANKGVQLIYQYHQNINIRNVNH